MTTSAWSRRHLPLFFAALLCIGSAVPAAADTIFITGNTTGGLATATEFASFNPQTNTFTFTIFNTSPFDARITGIGFDLPPEGNASPSGLNGFTGSVTFQPAGVNFTFSDADLGNVPQFNSVVLDFGFLTGASFSGGNPPTGLPPGIAPGDEATFVVSGAAFAGFTESQIANSIFIRFQSVGINENLSDVGVPRTSVPEPGTMTLMGLGLAAACLRRMRRAKSNQH